jgi:hypothetical protein
MEGTWRGTDEQEPQESNTGYRGDVTEKRGEGTEVRKTWARLQLTS